MNNYKEYNDYELLYLTIEGSEEASNMLFKKYKVVAELKARKYYKKARSLGLDFNDLVQEGMIGFNEAIGDFKLEKDVQFATFASLCIERQIGSAVLMASRNKHKILNESISLDYTKDKERPAIEYLIEDKENDPLLQILDMEDEKETYRLIQKELTDFENQVLQLKVSNFNYKEMAEILNKPVKSIDNTLQRIKNKIRLLKMKK